MPANHLAMTSVSRPSGRDSLMVEYFSFVGICQMKLLLPPSSRVSMTTSTLSPSQLVNAPRLWSSSLTTNATDRVVLMSSRGCMLFSCYHVSVRRLRRSRSMSSSARSWSMSGSKSLRASSLIWADDSAGDAEAAAADDADGDEAEAVGSAPPSSDGAG